MANGWYAIDDKQFYLNIRNGGTPVIKSKIRGGKELVLPVNKSNIDYSIIW